jgi:arylsulfatase A-like enzyme
MNELICSKSFPKKEKKRKIWKSFIMTLRIIFVLSTLKFIYDAFYKWDGYSFRMHFIDFLPDLSLTFILWMLLAIIFAFTLWLVIYVVLLMSQVFIKSIQFEHVMIWFVIVAGLLFIKRTYIHVNLHELFGINQLVIRIIGVLLVAMLVWIGRKWFEKIPQIIDTRITPLVWLFAFLFVIAIPLSFYKHSSTEASETRDNTMQLTNLKEGEKRPNIILVVMDALTSKDMSLYGYELPTTPFISRWAEDAIVFKNVYSTSNWTTPAMMSMMTGQRPWTHRTWYRPNFTPKDRNYENNMPRILRDYGYEVISFVQNRYAHPDTLGIDRAFLKKDKPYTFMKPREFWFFKIQDKIKRPVVSEWIFYNNFIAEKILEHQPDLLVTFYPPDYVYNSFLKYISNREQHSRPFFAWLHTFPPHDPYLPPKPYMGMFGEAEKFNTLKKQLRLEVTYREYPPEKQPEVDIFRKRYDEFILYSDKQFELFIGRLQETIDMSNTIIILTSDHGQSFSHGWQAHDGPYLYESLVRVPLIIKIPGKITGRVIETPVEITDIAPTILELAGIPIPTWVEGRSLVPLINGRNDSRPVFAMQLIKNKFIGNEPITKGTFAVRKGDYKLIYYLEEDKSLLFNLKDDPDETHNIFEEESAVAQRLLRLIKDELSQANARITQAKESS